MRSILVNDFPGYPYPIQLSRELARRGHSVTHVYTPSVSTTPTGLIIPRPDDPPSLTIEPVVFKSPLNKHNLAHRLIQERQYGRHVARIVRRTKPDTVVSANCPLDANGAIQSATRAVDAQFVYWVQDLLGVAAKRVLAERIPLLGALIGQYYEQVERKQLRASDAVVVLTKDFEPIVESAGVLHDRITTIENWAPVADLPALDHSEWSKSTGYEGVFVFLYAGSLGMKHNPALLVQLAQHFVPRPDVRIVVLTQGQGAAFLRDAVTRNGLANLDVLPYEPFDKMPDVLASSSVLIGILEESAGVYSVPSKILAYLCANRPILASVPTSNLAARIVMREEAGLVADPSDVAGFIDAAEALYNDASLRDRLGRNGRAYAEKAFDIGAVADQFLSVIHEVSPE